MGSAAAWHLAERGLSVLGVDRHTPPHHYGSSHGACPDHPGGVPRAPAVRAARAACVHVVGHAGGRQQRRSPEADRGIDGWAAGRAAGLGCDAQRGVAWVAVCALDSGGGPRARARAEPGRRHGGSVGAACRRALSRALHRDDARAAAGRGAELLYETTVTGWDADNAGVTVATSAHDYRAGRLVLAGGPWMPELLPTLAPAAHGRTCRAALVPPVP